MERPYRPDGDWRVLCEQASKEKDPNRLLELVRRLNEVLEEQRLKQRQRQSSNASSLASRGYDVRDVKLCY